MSPGSLLRPLARAPWLTVAVVVTLAIGVGGLTTTFGIVDAALFRPPPFHDARRLAMLFMVRTSAGEGARRERWSFARAQLLRRTATSFEAVANYSLATLTLTGNDTPQPASGEVVSATYFPLLRVQPVLGRTFTEEEDDPSRPATVVLLGHDLWKRRYAGDSSIVGRTIGVSGLALTVIGVLPPRFRGLTDRADLWVPATLAPRLTYPEYLTSNQSFISVAARLRPQTDLAAAQAELRVLGARIDAELPLRDREPGQTVSAEAVPLNEARVDTRTRRSLFVLLAAVALLHLLACANVTSLLLGHAAARRREAAVRLALGSSPGRLFREFMGHGVLLSAIGTAAGLLLAYWTSAFLVLPENAWGPRNFYGSIGSFDRPDFGLRTLGFGILLGVATALLVAGVPAAGVLRADLANDLREGAKGSDAGAGTLRRPSVRGVIVALEATLATVLLVSAGLLIESFARMRRTDLGVDADRVLTFMVRPPEVRVPTAAAPAFITRILAAVVSVPGVEAATVDGGAPVSGSARSVLHIAGRAEPDGWEPPPVLRHYVGPDHFRVLGVPLLRGRAFTASDVAGRPRVAIISESAARRFWPGEDPIGKRVWFGGGSSFDRPDSSAEIVGIVGDVVYEPLDLNPNRASFYTPYAQFTYGWRTVLVRTSGDPLGVVSAMRQAVRSVDPDLPLYEVQTLRQLIGGSWARHRFDAMLFGLFGAAALLLAVSGLYAVVSYSVARRTREMGIRLALGAPGVAVVRLVVREGMAWPVVGFLAGIAGALAVTRLLQSSLYEVRPTEPRVFAAAMMLLAVVSVAACFVPALRATRVDPLQALRAE